MASSGPRYAPADPTLPSPWRGLIDGSSGYIYYWNPETNITQYEKPGPALAPLPVSSRAPQPVSSAPINLNGNTNIQSVPNRGNGAPYSNGNNSNGISSSQRTYEAQGSASQCSESEADEYRRKHQITVVGDTPPPFLSFAAANFPSEIANELSKAGFPSPSPIQAQSWPVAMQGRDVVAVAKTGSGKTLGFLLPGFLHLKRRANNPRMGPTVVVMAPTRELATQIHEEAVKFGRSSYISSTCVYGGAPKGPQLRDIDRGVDVVIATPGRLNDFLEMRRISLRQVSFLVLDEADRMLDMGFEPQIRKIVAQMPSSRQTLMYTATWPKEVRKIAQDLLKNPVQVNIGNTDQLEANKAIEQIIDIVEPFNKQRKLEDILRGLPTGYKVIIFCTTKRTCDQLARGLNYAFGAAAIHGDKSQQERDFVLANFRSGKSPILVATDVAARGLDVKDVSHVINFDFPTGVEDYVHRIGRTGRAGATGIAITFFTNQDGKFAKDLISILEGAGQKVPQQLRDMANSGSFGRVVNRWGGVRGGGDRRDFSNSAFGNPPSRGPSLGEFPRSSDYGQERIKSVDRVDKFRSRDDRYQDDRHKEKTSYSRSPRRRSPSRSPPRGRTKSRTRSKSRSRSRSHSPYSRRGKRSPSYSPYSRSRSPSYRKRSRSPSYDRYRPRD